MISIHLLTIPLVATLTQAVSFDCSRVLTAGVNFDLSKLKGPHSVSYIEDEPPSVSNTTFTIDICQPLAKENGTPNAEQCPIGTRVCAVERDTSTINNSTHVKRVIPIAGDFAATTGGALDPKITRLKHSASNSDSALEGVRVEFNGGKYPEQHGQVQRAIVQFECDPDRTGNEETKPADGKQSRREEGDKDTDKDKDKDENKGGDEEGKGDDNGEKGDPDDKDPDENKSLRFISYKDEDNIQVLRLSWRTKYACEDVPDEEGSPDSTKGWGFFGWLFIIVFLGAAAYLIFGSWLNYTRYGARGWDLIPHGDAIRDMPYIVKDWGRSVVDTVQGRGYRGGYSAV